jgi:hypothetical protein
MKSHVGGIIRSCVRPHCFGDSLSRRAMAYSRHFLRVHGSSETAILEGGRASCLSNRASTTIDLKLPAGRSPKTSQTDDSGMEG